MKLGAWLAMWLAAATLTSAADLRERRSLKKFKIPAIGALVGTTGLGSSLGSALGFGGGQSQPEIPDLSQYPLWKVHRYHGISLQPVHLPGNEVHPYPPPISGEPPSVVNVPEPHHAPPTVLPANEYDPRVSNAPAPYPPAAPAGPYPPPSATYPAVNQAPYPAAAPYPQSSGPHPPVPTPYSPASSPYPSAPAPYPPAASPSAPYPPEYSTAYSSVASSSAHSSAHSSAFGSSSSAYAAPAASASSQSAAGSSTGSIGGIPDSFTLPAYLPPEMVQKIQQYISTPEGRSKADIILGFISGAQNLKSSATSSLQSMMQRLFGGAGGSSNVAIESGTYTNVPQNYPGQQGWLNKLRAVGTGVSGSALPKLPEPSPLPSIPGLKKIPDAPALPHINLPAIRTSANPQSGRYVSISLPQPAPVPAAAPAAPLNSYGTPIVPSTSYGTPVGPTYPYTEGGDISTFFQQPQDGYGVPGDTSQAGTEDQEQFEPFVPEEFLEQEQGQEQGQELDQGQRQQQELEQEQEQKQVLEQVQEQVQHQVALVPLRTTKLHRVQGEDLRAYAARRPVYKGFRPIAKQMADNEVTEGAQN